MFEHHLTSENGYITAVKSALLRQGFWGQPVRKLLEELRDHFHTKTGTLEAEGRPLPEALKQAAAALGEPEAIAMEWGRTLKSKNWMARHPLLTVGLGIIGILVYYPLIMLLCVLFEHISKNYAITSEQRHFYQVLTTYLFNWMPWEAGMFFLVWRMVRFPGGWKALFVGCLALGLATSALEFNLHFPGHAGSGVSITFVGETWSSLLVYPFSPQFAYTP